MPGLSRARALSKGWPMTADTDRLLRIYLNDHYLGANAGVSLARRIARSHQGTSAGAELRLIAVEIEQDLATLVEMMHAVRVTPSKLRAVAGLAAERAGRLKLNGRLLTRSPLSSVIELEALLTGVAGKKAGWAALRCLADENPNLDAVRLDQLLDRARGQMNVLERLRLSAVTATFQSRAPVHR
jgi:hypothetical protein